MSHVPICLTQEGVWPDLGSDEEMDPFLFPSEKKEIGIQTTSIYSEMRVTRLLQSISYAVANLRQTHIVTLSPLEPDEQRVALWTLNNGHLIWQMIKSQLSFGDIQIPIFSESGEYLLQYPPRETDHLRFSSLKADFWS